MRTKKSFYNAASNSIILLVRTILMFIVRIVFIKTLGEKLLGVDSLFTNLLLVLSLADSGMNTAICYTLYKPLSDKDYDKVSTIMTFYKKVYRFLGIIVLLVGLLLIPFLNIIITSKIDHIVLYYFIYLLTTAMSYFISYKDALLNADQNQYKSSLIVGITYILMYILRIVFLYLIPNFLLYALIQFIALLIQRVLINIYITKKYKHINFNNNKKLTKKEEKSIYKNVYSIFINKLGGYLVNGTDNIVISSIKTLGLSSVAIYTNYYSVIGATDNIINKALSGITASFGDLAVNESKDIQENVFDIIAFISFFIYGLLSVGFFILLTPFISACFGTKFGLSTSIIIVICFNFYIQGLLKPLDIIKEATGNYVQDRFANLIQAFINIVLSFVLGIRYGLFGVVLATLISYISVALWNKPYIAYKYIFKQTPIKFFLKQLLYLLSIIIISSLCLIITNKIVVNSFIISFIIKGIIVSIIYLLLMSILFHKTKEYKYLQDLVKTKLLRIK